MATAPRETPLPWSTFGAHLVDPNTHEQMKDSMRLPVSVAGALLPDAHVAYGLPVGGVLATENAVVPYAVGVDIACRMMVSLVDARPKDLEKLREKMKRALVRETAFGAGRGGLKRRHLVLDDERFKSIPVLRTNRNKAIDQLGSSGGGNHFVEWGEVELLEPVQGPYGKVRPGSYLALMSHSGSRGLGFAVARHYTELAKKQCHGLPPELKNLAWLDMDSEAGQEYWAAMELCGEYASANHHLIHEHVARSAGLSPLFNVENHHNFAWRERHRIDGAERDVIVHRKGATPAGEGVLGVIPGSMADAGYIVRGTGNELSLQSASHGAGRVLGRREAARTIPVESWKRYVAERGVELLGGGIDEAPQAYKSIDAVIAAQKDLVEPIAEFKPRIVLMCPDDSPV